MITYRPMSLDTSQLTALEIILLSTLGSRWSHVIDLWHVKDS